MGVSDVWGGASCDAGIGRAAELPERGTVPRQWITAKRAHTGCTRLCAYKCCEGENVARGGVLPPLPPAVSCAHTCPLHPLLSPLSFPPDKRGATCCSLSASMILSPLSRLPLPGWRQRGAPGGPLPCGPGGPHLLPQGQGGPALGGLHRQPAALRGRGQPGTECELAAYKGELVISSPTCVAV